MRFFGGVFVGSVRIVLKIFPGMISRVLIFCILILTIFILSIWILSILILSILPLTILILPTPRSLGSLAISLVLLLRMELDHAAFPAENPQRVKKHTGTHSGPDNDGGGQQAAAVESLEQPPHAPHDAGGPVGEIMLYDRSMLAEGDCVEVSGFAPSHVEQRGVRGEHEPGNHAGGLPDGHGVHRREVGCKTVISVLGGSAVANEGKRRVVGLEKTAGQVVGGRLVGVKEVVGGEVQAGGEQRKKTEVIDRRVDRRVGTVQLERVELGLEEPEQRVAFRQAGEHERVEGVAVERAGEPGFEPLHGEHLAELRRDD